MAASINATKIVPPYYRIWDKFMFDYSTERFDICPSNENRQENLNKVSDIRFPYSGEKRVIRLGWPRSGFKIKAGFVTCGGADDAHSIDHLNTANTTLSSNWAMHLFSKAEIKLGSRTIEIVVYPGVVSDIYIIQRDRVQ